MRDVESFVLQPDRKGNDVSIWPMAKLRYWGRGWGSWYPPTSRIDHPHRSPIHYYLITHSTNLRRGERLFAGESCRLPGFWRLTLILIAHVRGVFIGIFGWWVWSSSAGGSLPYFYNVKPWTARGDYSSFVNYIKGQYFSSIVLRAIIFRLLPQYSYSLKKHTSYYQQAKWLLSSRLSHGSRTGPPRTLLARNNSLPSSKISSAPMEPMHPTRKARSLPLTTNLNVNIQPSGILSSC